MPDCLLAKPPDVFIGWLEARLSRLYGGADFRCHDIHSAMSLKYAHLYNDFAHLKYLDSLPELQGDFIEL